jgi:hypothetical protein
MANQTNSPDNQDLDLGQLSGKIRGYLSKANDSFFDGILFIKRNIIILTVLVLVGVGLGIYKDETSNRFENKIFVIPNFGSVDYLYEEVTNITSKIRQKDKAFLAVSGIKSPEKLIKIEIEPVVEIYDFIEDKDVDEDDRKFQLFRLISENGDMDKMLKDNTTSRNYKNHLITITTNGTADKSEIIDPLLKYLNSNSYYVQLKDEYVNNLNLKIAANDTIIKQIDNILNDFTGKGKNGNLIYYNDNTQLNEVIKVKNRLIKEQAKNRIDAKVNYSDIIKEGSSVLNATKSTILSGRMKYIIPLLFILVFVICIKFRDYYRSQINKRKTVGL